MPSENAERPFVKKRVGNIGKSSHDNKFPFIYNENLLPSSQRIQSRQRVDIFDKSSNILARILLTRPSYFAKKSGSSSKKEKKTRLAISKLTQKRKQRFLLFWGMEGRREKKVNSSQELQLPRYQGIISGLGIRDISAFSTISTFSFPHSNLPKKLFLSSLSPAFAKLDIIRRGAKK